MPNGPIRVYLISYFPIHNASDFTRESVAPPTMQYHITGLTAFTNYSISVAAYTNAEGDSSPSVVVITQEGSKHLLTIISKGIGMREGERPL